MATAEQTHISTKLNRTRPPPDQYDPTGSEAYRSQAGDYDQRTAQFQHWRELLIEQLPAKLGYLALGHIPAAIHQSTPAVVRTPTVGNVTSHPTKGTAT